MWMIEMGLRHCISNCKRYTLGIYTITFCCLMCTVSKKKRVILHKLQMPCQSYKATHIFLYVTPVYCTHYILSSTLHLFEVVPSKSIKLVCHSSCVSGVMVIIFHLKK